MNSLGKSAVVVVLITALGGFAGAWIAWNSDEPTSHYISIKARQYAFEPSVIRVNRGDTLHIKLISLDVVHGFFLEGYDLDAEIFAHQKSFNIRHPSKGKEWSEVNEFTLITNRRGKFRYRCSHTCGSMHPFMQGELIVQPNTPFHASVGGTLGLFVGMLWTFAQRRKTRLFDNGEMSAPPD